MRGSPSCVIAVGRSRVWRLAVAVASVLALASLAAWAATAEPGRAGAVAALALLAGLGVAACSLALLRLPTGTLRWDGASWAFAATTGSPAPIESAQLEVAIDLGGFLLLRLLSRRSVGRASVLWIAAERRGLEREWHSFRCAVYSPRPVPGMAGDADPRFP